jgi:superfamily II DNA/RNA helicase
MQKVRSKDLDLEFLYTLPVETIVSETKNLKHPLDQLEEINEFINDISQESSPIYMIYQIILLLGFIPYKWQMYKTKYYGKTREQVRSMLSENSTERKSLMLQLSIYGILRTIFLKRLESSVSAVRTSVNTYKDKLLIFETGVKDNKIITIQDLKEIEKSLGEFDDDSNSEIDAISEEGILDEIKDHNYNKDQLLKDIQKEKALLEILDKHLEILEQDDSKLKAFVELLEKINTTKPAGEKVLIFSYYADTIDYLESTLAQHTNLINQENTGFISSKTRGLAENLAERFSPKSKKYQLKENETELKYLFSTDVLSEGQNLQDCGILINYDLHWSPTRMIQRNGRVNRLGTEFDKVYIYNISPEKQLEEYLKLVNRLEGKINIIRNTIGTDTPVLDEDANPIEFSDKIQDIYSEDEQARIKALLEAEKEADFLLSEDEFVNDLKWFNSSPEISEEYKKQIYNIPLRKWGIMPQKISRGAERAQVLALAELLNSENQVTNHRFAKINRDGSMFEVTNQLQALEWLKAKYDTSEQRLPDKINLNKVEITDLLKLRIENHTNEKKEYQTTKQEQDLLRLMHELQFNINDIDTVRDGFATTNKIDKEAIKQLTRKIIQDRKNNLVPSDKIKELINIAKDTFNHKKTLENHEKINLLLFYSKING